MAVRKSGVNFLEDRTESVNKIENMYGLVTQMGIFEDAGVRTRTFQYDQIEKGFALIEDRPWGARRDQFADKQVVQTHTFAIPRFTFDGHIKPSDVQSQRRPGTDAEFSTLDEKIAEELMTINNSWAQTREWARLQLLKDGTVYAPNGTVVTNYYSQLGVSQKTVYFDFSNSSAIMQEKGEEAIAHIQDNLQEGMIVTDFVSLDSPSFFSSLIKHASVKEAYNQFSATNANGNILRDRLPTVMGGFRSFVDQSGILHIEYRGKMKGQDLIPAGEARIVPVGALGLFKTIYAPMEHNDYVNTVGVPMYAFVYENDRGQGYDIETDSNFANFCSKPQLIVKAVSGADPG